MNEYMTATTALKLIAGTNFEPFTATDFATFSGVETDSPLIGYNGDWAIVIDGETVVFENTGEWFIFKLNLEYNA